MATARAFTGSLPPQDDYACINPKAASKKINPFCYLSCQSSGTAFARQSAPWRAETLITSDSPPA